MKVYVVLADHDYNNDHLVGVFDDRDKVKDAILKHKGEYTWVKDDDFRTIKCEINQIIEEGEYTKYKGELVE